MKTEKMIIKSTFSTIKRYFPAWIYNPIRMVARAVIGPIYTFGYKSGYFLSCFKMTSVSKNGSPLPWYPYPVIDFLSSRDYTGKKVLEFGGGQSTLWWAARAKKVVTLEGNAAWYQKLSEIIPSNVALYYVSMDDLKVMDQKVCDILEGSSRPENQYDVIIIDGLIRAEMVPIAKRLLAQDGMIICDNSDSSEHNFYDLFKSEIYLNRVDFYGIPPGIAFPHCTSIYFPLSSYSFKPEQPIPGANLSSKRGK